MKKNHNFNQYRNHLKACLNFWSEKGIIQKPFNIDYIPYSKITWQNYSGGYGYNKNYLQEYNDCEANKSFSVKFTDEALLQISVHFDKDILTKARYAYLGLPSKGFTSHLRFDYHNQKYTHMLHDPIHLQVPGLPEMRLCTLTQPPLEVLFESLVRWFYPNEWKDIFPIAAKILQSQGIKEQELFSRLRQSDLSKYFEKFAEYQNSSVGSPLKRLALQVSQIA